MPGLGTTSCSPSVSLAPSWHPRGHGPLTLQKRAGVSVPLVAVVVPGTVLRSPSSTSLTLGSRHFHPDFSGGQTEAWRRVGGARFNMLPPNREGSGLDLNLGRELPQQTLVPGSRAVLGGSATSGVEVISFWNFNFT